MLSQRTLTALVLILTLAGCATPGQFADGLRSTVHLPLPVSATSKANNEAAASASAAVAANANRKDSDPKTRLFLGSGEFIKAEKPDRTAATGDQRFNFENADVREIVRNILGDILNENFVLDPAVQGAVTFRTYKPIPASELIPLLEMMLRQTNAALVKDSGLWRVVPAANALRGVSRPVLGGSGRTAPAFGMTIVPLKFMGVGEMQRILEPIAKDGATSVRIDLMRNMLILTGTPSEVRYLLDTIDMFDIDWMAGMSVGLFTLEHAEAKTIMSEVEKILGPLSVGQGPLAGLVRVQVIERLNAILVITPQKHMIEQAEKWIRRLDKGGDDGTGSRMYVYHLQNTSAEKLAPLLQQAMSGRAAPGQPASAQVAPGQTPVTIQTPTIPTNTQNLAPQPAVQPRPATPPAAAGQGSALARNATIIADKDRNALIIVGSPAEYSAIESAIRKLDVMQRQVMVNVTVVEVDLTDELALGVEWAVSRAEGTAGKPTAQTGLAGSSGLSYIYDRADLVGGILKTLNAKLTANDGTRRARIAASPSIMAVDNTPVQFQVGRQVSVQTQSVVNNTTTTGTTNSFQYLSTGIIVSVTPRISAGGLVNLEITQEISEPVANTATNNSNPDITRTAIKNTVLVQSGETMVLGGLIREKISDSSSGVPGLSRLPFIGAAFGRQGYNVDKTEVLLLVRPVVINNIEQAREVSDEFRRKMQGIQRYFGQAEVPANVPTTVLPPSSYREVLPATGGPAK